MADVELLPLPPLHIAPSVEPVDYPDVAQALMDYARANVAHATAARDAEIEALRAEVERSERYAEQSERERLWAEARAERLAEALREAEKLLKRTPRATRDMYVDAGPIGWGVQAGNVLAMIRAALAKENSND